jgi:hypothetical protein
MSRKVKKPKPIAVQVRSYVEEAQKAALAAARATIKGEVPDVGTGETIIKFRQPPVAYLIDKRRIGSAEQQAASAIELAFYTLSSSLMVKGISYDRVDSSRGHDLPWSVRVADTVKTYQKWANVWSDRNKQYCDPTLEIVIAAVIDERHIRGIAQDLCFRPAKIERAIICGLRDYAVRAEIVDGRQAQAWTQEAEREFAITPASIRLTAYARARLER